MRRKLFTIAAAISFTLASALCVEWGRSYYAADYVAYDFSDENPGTRVVGFASSEGAIVLNYNDHPTALYANGWRGDVDEPWAMRGTPGWRTFEYVRRDQKGGRFWGVYFPHWLAIAVLAIPPALWVVSVRQHRRRVRQGRCVARRS
jgi:hypothetical protein